MNRTSQGTLFVFTGEILMKLKYRLISIFLTGMLGVVTPSDAALYEYTGLVVEATGAYETFLPVGTPVIGYMVFEDAAVQSGFVGETDLLDIQIEMGEFCLYLLVSDCTGFPLPLNIINNVEILFDANGNITGGEIDIESFSPTEPYLPFLFDFDANMLTTPNLGLGVFTVEATITPQVPVPGAIWFFGSAGLLFAIWRKKATPE